MTLWFITRRPSKIFKYPTRRFKPCVKSPSGEAREHICHWCRPGRDHNTENKNAHVSTYFRLTSPPAYSVVRTVLGDKKSRFLRFLALLSLNQSFSRSRLISASCSASLRNAPLNALTVDTMLNGTASSMIRLSMLTLLFVPGLERCYWDWLLQHCGAVLGLITNQNTCIRTGTLRNETGQRGHILM